MKERVSYPELNLLEKGAFAPNNLDKCQEAGRFEVAWESVVASLYQQYAGDQWSEITIARDIRDKYGQVGERMGINMANRAVGDEKIAEYLANLKRMCLGILSRLDVDTGDKEILKRVLLADLLVSNMTVNLSILGNGGGREYVGDPWIELLYRRLDGGIGKFKIRAHALEEGLAIADGLCEFGTIGKVTVVGPEIDRPTAADTVSKLARVIERIGDIGTISKLGIIYVTSDYSFAAAGANEFPNDPGLILYGTQRDGLEEDLPSEESLFVHELKHDGIDRTYPGYSSHFCHEVGATVAQADYCQGRGYEYPLIRAQEDLSEYRRYLMGVRHFMFLPFFQLCRDLPNSSGNSDYWRTVANVFLQR